MFGEDLKRAPSLQQRRYGPMVRPNVDVWLIRAKCGVCKVIPSVIARQSSEGPSSDCPLSINGGSSPDPSLTQRERGASTKSSKAVEMMAIA